MMSSTNRGLKRRSTAIIGIYLVAVFCLLTVFCQVPAAGAAPPTVTSHTPADGVTAVGPSAQITATFDQDIDPATITTGSFTLSKFVGIKTIAARSSNILAVRNDGKVIAWGGNGYSYVPAGLSEVKTVAAGYYHSLALKTDGTVVAWGMNNYGQTTIPTGLTGVKAIAAGKYFSLALKEDGKVVAWGSTWDAGDASYIPLVPCNI